MADIIVLTIVITLILLAIKNTLKTKGCGDCHGSCAKCDKVMQLKKDLLEAKGHH